MKEFATNYGISRPIEWILYRYTDGNRYSTKDLAKFTRNELIPFISTIDTSEYNARRRRERIIRWILLHMGAYPAIEVCKLLNMARNSVIGIKKLIGSITNVKKQLTR